MSWLHICKNHDYLLCELEDDRFCSCGQSKGHHIYAAPAPALTLRDWFAGQALNGMLSSMKDAVIVGIRDHEQIAHLSYVAADSMLKEGGKND